MRPPFLGQPEKRAAQAPTNAQVTRLLKESEARWANTEKLNVANFAGASYTLTNSATPSQSYLAATLR